MELEEYETTFRDNDEQVELLERFWCAKCNHVSKHFILYTKESEWEE
jgi:hypothetical protein